MPEHTSCAALEPPRAAEASPEGLEDVTGTLWEPHPGGDPGPQGWFNRADRKSVSQQLFLMLRQSRA